VVALRQRLPGVTGVQHRNLAVAPGSDTCPSSTPSRARNNGTYFPGGTSMTRDRGDRAEVIALERAAQAAISTHDRVGLGIELGMASERF
jgi:hypothetical protein